MIFISRAAENDLAHIYAFLASEDLAHSDRFRKEAESALSLLEKHPELGPKPGWKTRHTRLRSWVIRGFNNYLIYCEPMEDGVSIERVLDGRRDVRRMIEKAWGHRS